jgi:mannose-6-phosphate isomerase-like protein (cupin superfamily)
VTAVGFNGAGEEYCEKEITVHPGHILSLQSHQQRRETWTVQHGILTIILDGQSVELTAGGVIHVPQKSIHCMANLGTESCVVHERQEGICREEDIYRYVDNYGRADTASGLSPAAVKSVTLYNDMVEKIRQSAK